MTQHHKTHAEKVAEEKAHDKAEAKAEAAEHKAHDKAEAAQHKAEEKAEAVAEHERQLKGDAEDAERIRTANDKAIAAVVDHHTNAPNGITPEMIARVLELLPHLRAEGNLFLQDVIALVAVLKQFGVSTLPEATRILGLMADDIQPILADVEELLALLHPTPLPLPLVRSTFNPPHATAPYAPTPGFPEAPHHKSA